MESQRLNISKLEMTKDVEELYLYKFKKYLSSVSRYIRNQQIKNIPYRKEN